MHADVLDRVASDSELLRWLEAIPRRHSRRSYTGATLPESDLAALTDLAHRWRPSERARAVVVPTASASIFMGVIGAYGGISGSPSALAFLGMKDAPPELVGYTGQALVLEATARGIGTCWVAGLFSSSAVAHAVAVEDTERVFAVSPIGIVAENVTMKERAIFGAARAKHRRSLDEIAPGHERWPAWAQAGVSAARIAPSATNRQPWRFSLDAEGALVVSFDGMDTPRTSKRLDCGIAMLHAEAGAMGQGVRGVWELLQGRSIARFRPEDQPAAPAST